MMKIVFINVWGDDMLEALVPYIQAQSEDTDVFCMQEATAIVRQRCRAVLSDYVEVSDSKYVHEKDKFAQATFVRKTLEVLESTTLLSETDDAGLAVHTKIRIGTQSIAICNVHGKARPAEKLDDPGRILQSETLVDFYKNATEPVIIGGDFNILPATESIGMFARHGYRDLIEEYGIETTRNRLAWQLYPTKMYFSDYVFIKGAVSVRKFTVPKLEISDHLPMELEIQYETS